MAHEQFLKNIVEFDQILAGLRLRIEDGSLLKAQFDLTREFLQDKITFSENQLTAKWDPRFKEFYDAQIVVGRLTDSVVILRGQPEGALRKRLKLVLVGPLTQDLESQQAKDHFYELEMAALLQQAGFAVELREPDVVVAARGLTKSYGIACKYPSSEKQINDHISKGYKQISNQNLDGLVALGLDQIVFKGMSKFLDFRQYERPPLEVMQQIVDEAMYGLVAQRAKDYPSECPVDGVIVTLAASGVCGEPACLRTVRAITLQCDSQNPMSADIQLILSGLRKSETSA